MKKLFYSLFTLAMTAVMFTSCESVPAPYDDPNNNPGGGGTVVVDPVGDGTQENPYNVIAAINYAKTLDVGAESERDIYIKGVVVSIAENYTTQYGNARFYISDDGTAKNQFLIYRALYLGNKKYTDGDILAEGDTVIICGKVTNYNGTLETQQNKAFLYSLNGKSEGGGGGGGATGEAKGSGTLEDPYNPAGASAAVANLTWTSNDDYQTTGEVYVKGKISRIADKGTFTDGGSYGNASFYISEDGTQNGEFYCFRILYLGNKKFESGKTDIKVGDDVIVCGQLMNYRGNTPETVAGKAYLYSLNGNSESGGGGSTETIGSADAPITTAKAIELINALADGGKTSEKAYVKGKIVKVATTEENFAKYGNLNYYISDDGSSTNQIQVYAGDGLNGEKFKSISDIKAGDEVVVFGVLYKYVNKSNTVIPEITDSYLVKLTEGSGGGGGTDEIKTVSIAEFNAAPESSVWYKLSGTVKNLKDGDQYGNFDLEDNTGSVYVYGLLSEKGGEKKQFQTLAAAKGIKNGVKITIIGNRGSYNGKIEVMNAYFVSVDGEGGGGDTPQSAGTYNSPLTVSQAISLAEADAAWVKGYIVGYVKGTPTQLSSNDVSFSAENASNTNIVIAASSSEKDVSKCMPVQLTRNKGREEFELDTNPDMLGKEVILAGQLTKYFGVAGFKSLTYIEANGKSVGNKVKFRKRR